MASMYTALAGQLSFNDFAAAGIVPTDLASHKLDRLRELRAVIATMRHEQVSRDPLLNWIIEREGAETRLHD